MTKKTKIAFTLIELLVVIAIIGILSGLIVVTMSGVTQKANIAKAQVFSNSLRNALMLNLVSEWKLDGNGTDSWGSNNGTITGATTLTADCVYGSCLSFDGNDYVTVPASSSLDITGYMTLAAWAKVSDKTATTTIVSKTESGAYNLLLNNTGYPSQVAGYIHVNGNYAVPRFSISHINNGEWFYLVSTYDGSTCKIYLNGQQMNSVPITGSIGISAVDFYIGAEAASSGATTPFFTGSIDDVRIYNAAIPASQIEEQYYAGLNSLLGNGKLNAEEYSQRIALMEK